MRLELIDIYPVTVAQRRQTALITAAYSVEFPFISNSVKLAENDGGFDGKFLA